MEANKSARRSLFSKLAEEAIRLTQSNTRYINPDAFARYIQKVRVSNERRFRPLAKIPTQKAILQFNDMQVVELCHAQHPKKLLIYLHGGAYVEKPLLFHWLFLDKITMESGYRVLVPLYPLAPVHGFTEAYDSLIAFYKEQLNDYAPQDIVLMGDSAGGGLTLGLCMELRRLGLPQPQQMILICPWLDVTMDNPEIARQIPLDPMLGVYGLREAGKLWARETDRKEYRISPLYGDLHDLAPMTVFIGTHELFLPDALRFRDKAQAENIPLTFYRYEGMNHVFPLFPVPEARESIDLMLSAMKRA